MKPPVLYRDSDNFPFYLKENGNYSSEDGFYSYAYKTLINLGFRESKFNSFNCQVWRKHKLNDVCYSLIETLEKPTKQEAEMWRDSFDAPVFGEYDYCLVIGENK